MYPVGFLGHDKGGGGTRGALSVSGLSLKIEKLFYGDNFMSQCLLALGHTYLGMWCLLPPCKSVSLKLYQDRGKEHFSFLTLQCSEKHWAYNSHSIK